MAILRIKITWGKTLAEAASAQRTPEISKVFRVRVGSQREKGKERKQVVGITSALIFPPQGHVFPPYRVYIPS